MANARFQSTNISYTGGNMLNGSVALLNDNWRHLDLKFQWTQVFE